MDPTLSRRAARVLLPYDRVNGVVGWHLDRLHRQPREPECFEVCDRAGVSALASVTSDVDLSNDDGRFMARMLGAVARREATTSADASSEEQALTRRPIVAEPLT